MVRLIARDIEYVRAGRIRDRIVQRVDDALIATFRKVGDAFDEWHVRVR